MSCYLARASHEIAKVYVRFRVAQRDDLLEGLQSHNFRDRFEAGRLSALLLSILEFDAMPSRHQEKKGSRSAWSQVLA